MKQGNPTNINTAGHWNDRYNGEEKRAAYAKESGSSRFRHALEFVKDGDHVLDLGCGIGTFCELVKDTKPTCEVVGADISPVAMDQNQARRRDITYLINHIGREQLAVENHFDVVFSGETLEHLDDPRDLFRDAHKYLKPRGWLIITTPNGEAIRTPEHTWIFTHQDVTELYTKEGFSAPEFVRLPGQEYLFVIMSVGRKEDQS